MRLTWTLLGGREVLELLVREVCTVASMDVGSTVDPKGNLQWSASNSFS